MANISVVSDRLVWLSDLTPVDVTEQALVTQPMSWRRDQSVGGNPLTLNSGDGSSDHVEFEKGLGVHAYCSLTYANDRDFNRLAATVGIDRETRGRGDCQFIVKGDGVELWSQRVRTTDPLVAVLVDITRVHEVSLVVEAGQQLDLADHADWAEARFLKVD